jgi:hypothetical protein
MSEEEEKWLEDELRRGPYVGLGYAVDNPVTFGEVALKVLILDEEDGRKRAIRGWPLDEACKEDDPSLD